MYPQKKYSDSQMKYLMSEMFRMAKMFLSYRNYNNDYFEQEIRLLKELNSRNIAKIFENQFVKSEGRVKNYQIRNEEFFHNMYLMKQIANEYYSYKNRLSVKRERNKIIENIINNFLISLLNIYYELTTDADEFNVKIDLKLVKFIEDFIKQNNDIINAVVMIYYHMFMLVYTKSEMHYSKLLEFKEKHLCNLDDLGRHRIFEALGNYCIMQYQQGGINYYKEAFNLINDEIKHGVRFNRKEFSEIFFTNKVEIASKIGEFKWADDFILNYKDRLNKENREDIVNFSHSIVAFESKSYRDSLDRLSKINLQHPLLRFRIRNYTLLNYYELNYVEQAFLMLDAYRHMLEKDKKIEKNRKERYSTFLYCFQKLLEIKSGSENTEIDLLKRDIELKSVFMKHWLLEKVDEL
jgi:hypothetical protein